MNKDQKLLAEAYEQVVSGTSSDFESKIKDMAGRGYGNRDFYSFGITPEGKKYAVIEQYEKYDDGDRWYEETNYYYEVEGEKGKYVSDAEGKKLITKAYTEHPELNKHVSQEIIDWHLNNNK